MNIYLKNNGDCYMLCRCGTAEAVAVPPDGIRPVPLEGDTFTLSLPHDEACDEAGIHIVLASTYTFDGLQEEDTVELYREKTAVTTVKGMQGHIWYDRGVALCRVAQPTAVTYTVVGEDALRQRLNKQYHADLRWSLLWEAVLDVSLDLLLELGGAVALFVMLWVAYGFTRALGIAAVALVACGLLTVLMNLLLVFPKRRRQHRQIVARLQTDAIAAYFAKKDGKANTNGIK